MHRTTKLVAAGAALVLLAGTLVLLFGPGRGARQDINAQRDLIAGQLVVAKAQLVAAEQARDEARRTRELTEAGLAVATQTRDLARQTRDIAAETRDTAKQTRDVAAETRDLTRQLRQIAAGTQMTTEELEALARRLLALVAQLEEKVPDTGALLP